MLHLRFPILNHDREMLLVQVSKTNLKNNNVGFAGISSHFVETLRTTAVVG